MSESKILFDDETMDTIECSLATIKAMLKQENNGYKTKDYLRSLPQKDWSLDPLGPPVDADARYAIVDWCFKIMETCEYRRETGLIAMSCLDHFMATSEGKDCLYDRSQFQLAALTAVYTAIKIHETQALPPKTLANLSSGAHTASDVEEMERRMLKAIQWRVNPPTASDFCRVFLDMVPEHVLEKSCREQILNMTKIQIDMSMLKYHLCLQRASRVAFCSLLNSVEILFSDESPKLYACMESLVGLLVKVESDQFMDLRDQLYVAAISHPSGYELLDKGMKNKSKQEDVIKSGHSDSLLGETFECESPVSVRG